MKKNIFLSIVLFLGFQSANAWNTMNVTPQEILSGAAIFLLAKQGVRELKEAYKVYETGENEKGVKTDLSSHCLVRATSPFTNEKDEFAILSNVTYAGWYTTASVFGLMLLNKKSLSNVKQLIKSDRRLQALVGVTVLSTFVNQYVNYKNKKAQE